jgi:hypothetical protein
MSHAAYVEEREQEMAREAKQDAAAERVREEETAKKEEEERRERIDQHWEEESERNGKGKGKGKGGKGKEKGKGKGGKGKEKGKGKGGGAEGGYPSAEEEAGGACSSVASSVASSVYVEPLFRDKNHDNIQAVDMGGAGSAGGAKGSGSKSKARSTRRVMTSKNALKGLTGEQRKLWERTLMSSDKQEQVRSIELGDESRGLDTDRTYGWSPACSPSDSASKSVRRRTRFTPCDIAATHTLLVY